MTEVSLTRRVDIHYRRLVTDSSDWPRKITLSGALLDALNNRGKISPPSLTVGERVCQGIKPFPSDIKCWNNHYTLDDNLVGGTLCLYRPDELQAVIQSSPEKFSGDSFPIFEISQIESSNFLKAIAYFLACDNHLYIIQSPSLQTSAFEHYFTWLLSHFGVIESGATVRLAAKFDKNLVGGDLDDIEKVTIGSHLESIGVDDNDGRDEYEVTEEKGVGKKSGIGLNVLRDILDDEETFSRIEGQFRNIREEDPSAVLGVDVGFYIRSRKRKSGAARARRQLMKTIQQQVSNLPDGMVTARGKDGIISDSEIRIKQERVIALAKISSATQSEARQTEELNKKRKSSLLDEQDAMNNMLEVHRQLLADGRIGEEDDGTSNIRAKK